MNIKILLSIPLLLLTPLLTHAGPILITGTPADDSSLPNTAASPKLGNLINFDSLTSCPTFPPSGCTNYSGNTFSGVTFSSPDGLYAIPYSAQTAPNELFDNSTDGTASITMTLAGGVMGIGVGIADSDPGVNIFLQPLNASQTAFGSPIPITILETGSNPGNGYFVIEDTTPDIFGLKIIQSAVLAPGSFSGLAIDDVQTTPEPSTLLLLSAGAVMFGALHLRKRA